MSFKRRLPLLAVPATVLATLLAGALTSSFSSDSSAAKTATPGKTLNGTATYYPNSLNGHKTSSGKRFHQNGHTAASNKIPPGTEVKVTNLKNGKSTDVKITDRGSKLGSHEIDLSKKAAREIGLTHKQGKVPVQIKVIGTTQGPS
jgi:rare lipoprotein A